LFLAGNNHSQGSFKGAAVGEIFKDVDKTWNVFQALGNVAFAYSFSMILIEIQVSSTFLKTIWRTIESFGTNTRCNIGNADGIF